MFNVYKYLGDVQWFLVLLFSIERPIVLKFDPVIHLSFKGLLIYYIILVGGGFTQLLFDNRTSSMEH